jgi:hypothetical protein
VCEKLYAYFWNCVLIMFIKCLITKIRGGWSPHSACTMIVLSIYSKDFMTLKFSPCQKKIIVPSGEKEYMKKQQASLTNVKLT